MSLVARPSARFLAPLPQRATRIIHAAAMALGLAGLPAVLADNPETGFGVVLAQSEIAQSSSGSAFAVHKSGKLLTNSHVVEGCSEVTLIDRDGRLHSARVEARDERTDLALVAVEFSLTRVAIFRREPIRAGEDVIAVGFPLRGLLATDLNVSKGIVSAAAGFRNDTSRLQISAAVQPGNSGGPLLDASGAVVGVVVSKLNAIAVASVIGDIPQNVNFAIKGEVASVFLKTYGLEPTVATAATVGLIAVPDVVENARQYTFVVECVPPLPTATSAEETREELKKSEEEAAHFWAQHDRRTHECVPPSSVRPHLWDTMSTLQQWSACEAAGTIRPRVRVTESGFVREEIDVAKMVAGVYRHAAIAKRGRWLSMYARVEGLSMQDVVEVSLLSPANEVLIARNVELRLGETAVTYLQIGKRHVTWRPWKPGQYTGTIRVIRDGSEMLNFSAPFQLVDSKD